MPSLICYIELCNAAAAAEGSLSVSGIVCTSCTTKQTPDFNSEHGSFWNNWEHGEVVGISPIPLLTKNSSVTPGYT